MRQGSAPLRMSRLSLSSARPLLSEPVVRPGSSTGPAAFSPPTRRPSTPWTSQSSRIDVAQSTKARASHGAKQFPTSVAPCGRSNVAPIRRLLGRLQFYKQPFLRICLLWLVHAVRRNTTPLALPASAAPVKGGCEASLRHSSQESRRYCLALAPRAPRWNALPGITRTRAGMRAWNVGRVESAELMAARRYASLPSDLGRRHVFATYRRGYRGLRSSSEIEGSSRGTESATLQMRSCYRAFPIFARVIYMQSNGRHLYSLMRWRSRKPLGSGYFNRWNVVIKCVYS